MIGFLAQIVIGIQRRLVPTYGWYLASAARRGAPPARGAPELPSAAFAKNLRDVGGGLPLIAAGPAFAWTAVVRAGSVLLQAGLIVNAVYIGHMLRAARAV